MEKGQLTNDQHQKFKAHLERVSIRRCNVCGTGNLRAQLDTMQALPYTWPAIMIGGTQVPFVYVTCDKCGQMTFFNARELGIIE